MTNKDLINQLVQNNLYVKFYRKNKLEIPEKLTRILALDYKDSLETTKIETIYETRGGKVSSFYQVSKSNDIGFKVNFCEVDIVPKLTKDFVGKMIEKTSRLDQRVKRNQFYLPIDSPLKAWLEKMGAKNNGVTMLALVEQGIDYLDQYDYDPDIEVCQLKKRDIRELVNLEYQAHKQSSTSRCGIMPKKNFEGFYKFVLKSNRQCIVLKENNVIIGSIVFGINGFGIAHVMSIAVHPDHQKRGVSKMLYHKMLKELKRRRVKCYSGVSTTTEVLGLAKKLNRVPIAVYLEL